MGILEMALLAAVLVSLSAWAYGRRTGHPQRGDLVSAAEPVPTSGPAAWVNPMGIIGLLLLLALIILLINNWRTVA